jgi:hypothetical protein
MKIIINESRLEKLALNYIKKELGEYTRDYGGKWEGLFIKDGEVVAGTTYMEISILDRVYYQFKNMFGIERSQVRSLIERAATELSGNEYIGIFVVEEIHV